MPRTNRRTFMLHAAACGSLVAAASVQAQPAKVDEKDTQAVALGYVNDTTRADTKKYPKHTNEQKCSNCALFQGKAGDAWGGCPLFGPKQVSANGWCSAYAKKG